VILKDDVPVGMLALGNRDAVLSFKRAIDHNVNLSSIVSRLFAPDFKLNEWLDSQGIPPPILGVNREGAMVVQKAAYAGATTRSVILTPQSLDEGVLVQIDALPDASAAREIYLSQVKVTTVGRQEGMSIVVDHHSVSRRHAEISYANGHYVLRDLKSKNGTSINGKKVEPGSISFLNSDDLLRFGQIAFAFRLRHTDLSSSLLLEQQTEKQAGETLSLRATNNSPNKHEDQTGDKTIVVTAAPGTLSQGEESTLQRLFIPAALLTSGAESSLSPTVVAAMQEAPALVTNMQGKLGAFLLKPGKRFLLGREKNCDIVLADISISRTHAEVFPGPEGLYIRNLQSSNGVQVNHTKIDSPYHLTSGDSIILGNITLYFVDHRPRKAHLPM
jgi:pSer/pThr/pTyr-binding forkhead associated (FHA) protein